MKEMDNEIDERRRRGDRVFSKIEMSDTVPISGLIIAQFIMKDLEHTTAIEKWGRKRGDWRLSLSLLSSSMREICFQFALILSLTLLFPPFPAFPTHRSAG